MGGLFIVPLPLAIPLILLVVALTPFIPASWPAIIVVQIYRGKRGDRPAREISKKCLKGIAWSFGIPCITVLVLWIMSIVQVVLVIWWAVGLCWRAGDINEWKRLGRQMVDLPREVQNLWLRVQVWGGMKLRDGAAVEKLGRGEDKNEGDDGEEETKRYTFEILGTPTSVRLLTIFPEGDYMAPLRGEIRSVDLRTNPTYDALSYTWADEEGETAKTGHISVVCNAKRGTHRQLGIGHNCEMAMRRLRRRDKQRPVWIDAVCINQADLEERSQQVKLMSRIFVSARQVVVYTGEGTPQTDGLYDWLNDIDAEKLAVPSGGLFSPQSALQFFHPAEGVLGRLQEVSNDVAIRMEEMGRLIRGYSERVKRLVRELRMVYSMGVIPRRPPEPNDLHRVLREYFSRRWFKRVWVLQEVSLPEMKRIRVLCGNRETTGERAMHLLSMLMSQGQRDIDVGRVFVLLRQKPVANQERSSRGSHLLDLLIETSGRQCEDPRDKIFGVLNIAHWLDGVGAGREELDKVSYFTPVAQVYAGYSALLIRRHGPGFFLSLIKSAPAIKGLPSWAADWTVPWPNSKSLQGAADFPARSRFASEKDKALEFDPKNKVMKIMRPRIVRGFFAWTGQGDGEDTIQTVEVKRLDREEVLVEIYPGLAMLLRQHGDDWTFVKVCPHALDKAGVERLVAAWSRTVVYQENPGRIQDVDEELGSIRSRSPRGYLGKTRVWRIV